MMDFLTEIMARKRERVAQAKELCAVEALRASALKARATARPHALLNALQDGSRLNVIAEVKRASPSKGIINALINPEWLARRYEDGGACAVSVLTEEDRFRGSLEDLRRVRAAVRLPLLRKDFIFDEYQLYEAACAGADALLLIVAALDDTTLSRLRQITEDELGMDALVEVHTREELRRAAACGSRLVGVNNRNLHSFEVSLDTSVELASLAPAGATMISESGLGTTDDLLRLRALGYKGFLIGETLMRAEEPEKSLRELIYGSS
ncbi:MAG: indole-3-glycerol phosphate synthase TrpC [Pyrinomonadaceae bacterium]|nr:indole-3-glycerol phosphate synthase TrpC [Pyrinomonadaceae bacterium]